VQAVNRSLDAQQVKTNLIASLLNVSRQRTEVVYALTAEGGQARTNWAERRLQVLGLEWADVTQKLSSRYGTSLLQASLLNATHPVPERRGVLVPL
jgi:hypothetical protein